MKNFRKHILLWLLPMLALRAFVPAGFMLDTSHGTMSMIVCPGHQTQSSDDRAGDGHLGSGTSTKHEIVSLCAFAAAAGAAPIASLPTMALGEFIAIDRVLDTVTTLDLPFGPARTQQSRAPPYFS